MIRTRETYSFLKGNYMSIGHTHKDSLMWWYEDGMIHTRPADCDEVNSVDDADNYITHGDIVPMTDYLIRGRVDHRLKAISVLWPLERRPSTGRIIDHVVELLGKEYPDYYVRELI